VSSASSGALVRRSAQPIGTGTVLFLWVSGAVITGLLALLTDHSGGDRMKVGPFDDGDCTGGAPWFL
jgi:hypothetical protein